MNSEDFALYLRHFRGAMAWSGAGNEEQGAAFPPHHPRFRLDEAALPTGAQLLLDTAVSLSAERNTS